MLLKFMMSARKQYARGNLKKWKMDKKLKKIKKIEKKQKKMEKKWKKTEKKRKFVGKI